MVWGESLPIVTLISTSGKCQSSGLLVASNRNGLCLFPEADYMYECSCGCANKAPQTEGLNRAWLSHSSGGQKSEIEVAAGWLFLEAVRENLVHLSLLASGGSGQSLVSLGLQRYRSSLCLFLSCPSPCVFLLLCLFPTCKLTSQCSIKGPPYSNMSSF